MCLATFLRSTVCSGMLWAMLAAPSTATTILASAQNSSNGHTYFLIGDDPQTGKGISWTDAEAFAVSLGGHLATVRSAEENAWIQQAFPQYPFLWIGLSDQRIEGVYEWVNGEPASYLNWYPGEPNNFDGDEDFVELYNFAAGGGGWNDNRNIDFDSSGWGFAAVAEVAEPSAVRLTLIAGAILAVIRRSRSTP